jgi:PAS domain S-box-containing protein
MSVIIAITALSAAAIVLAIANVVELRRRGRAERDARESERHYRLLAESSFDMLVRFDPVRQRRTYISPAVRRLYGYEPEEAMAMSAEEVIHPDDMARVQEAVSRLEQGEVPPVTYRGRRKDGSYIWVEASLKRSLNPETGETEVVTVVRDVGERIRYQEELQRAKEQADAANRAKSEFLGMMSHELRTPLNAVIGFTELMKEEVMGPIDNPHYRSYIADIHFSSTHLLNLINDILDVTKAEAGKLELQDDAFDLRQLIETVVSVSGPPIEKAGLAVGIDFPADLPLLRADERKVRQVFLQSDRQCREVHSGRGPHQDHRPVR